jgi:hypothetical protein
MGCIVVWTNLILCLIEYPAISIYRVVKDYVFLGIRYHDSCIVHGTAFWQGPTADRIIPGFTAMIVLTELFQVSRP